MTTSCPSKDKLLQLQDGQLTEAEYGELEAHVEHCPVCQRALDQMPVLVERAPLLPLPGDHSLSTIAGSTAAS